MTVDDSRRERRYSVALRIKLRYTRVDQFISKFATNLSRSGMFLASRNPKSVGTRLYFELRLADDSRVIEGIGTVRWNREYDREQPDRPYGMGIAFEELEDESRAVLEQALELRASRGDRDLDAIPGSDDEDDDGAIDPAITRGADDGDDDGDSAGAPAAPSPTAAAAPVAGVPAMPAEPADDANGRGRRPGRVTALMADPGDAVDEHGRRVADALQRARALAGGLADAGDAELAALLEVDAVPTATIDQASRELATRELGHAVDSQRYRAPRLAVEPVRAAATPAARPARAETLDAALHALESEDGGLASALAAERRASDEALHGELAALRQGSLGGGRAGKAPRAATDIPIDVDDDDVLELADLHGPADQLPTTQLPSQGRRDDDR